MIIYRSTYTYTYTYMSQGTIWSLSVLILLRNANLVISTNSSGHAVQCLMIFICISSANTVHLYIIHDIIPGFYMLHLYIIHDILPWFCWYFLHWFLLYCATPFCEIHCDVGYRSLCLLSRFCKAGSRFVPMFKGQMVRSNKVVAYIKPIIINKWFLWKTHFLIILRVHSQSAGKKTKILKDGFHWLLSYRKRRQHHYTTSLSI